MKILILLKKWPGGVGTVIRNVKKELEKRGYEVKTISREEDLGINSLVKSIFPLRKKVKQIMKKENYDILYTQDWSIAFPLLFPYTLFSKKHFCVFHGTQFGPLKILQKTVGNFMGKKLIVADSLNKKRFPRSYLIPNTVDMNQFKPLKKRRKFLGWIEKGSELIKKEEMEELSEELNIPLLIAKDFKYKEMNEKFYNKCKVFVSLPLGYAGCALSYMEAMATGVPKIVGNRNGEGFKYPFEKVEDFKNLKEAIEKAEERNYREWMKKNQITWSEHTEKLLSLFKYSRKKVA